MIADIAQLVELLICNQWVGSSSLSVGTIKKAPFVGDFLFLNSFLLSDIDKSHLLCKDKREFIVRGHNYDSRRNFIPYPQYS